MTTKLDKKLRDTLKAWEKNCPDDVMEVKDIRRAITESTKLKRLLASAKFELKGSKKGAAPYDDYTEKEVDGLLKDVESYVDELQDEQKEFAQLKTWLARVKNAGDGFPFTFVVKGNDKGSLYVNKREGVVKRSGRRGKSDIAGSKLHTGTATYKAGKLIFGFDSNARAPWKALLQKIVSKAGINMKVALGDSSSSDDSGT